MNEDFLPVVDPAKCTACGKCAQACPKKVIEILPLSKEVLVRCYSKDKGAATRKNCEVGCIACGICVKVCPYNAVGIENNIARIDLDKCKVCGLCVAKCPTNAIMDYIPHRPKAFITEKCIGCGICTSKCPLVAITGTINYPEVVQMAAAKKAAREKAKEASVSI
jgi:ferredoxin